MIVLMHEIQLKMYKEGSFIGFPEVVWQDDPFHSVSGGSQAIDAVSAAAPYVLLAIPVPRTTEVS
jgi:hypothetical protein